MLRELRVKLGSYTLNTAISPHQC